MLQEIFSIFISILVSIFIFLLYYHRKLFFYPKELVNIPSIPTIKNYKSMFNRTPHDESQIKFSEYMTRGVYRLWILNDWSVSISKYEYAKDYLSETVEALPKWTYPVNHPVRRFMGDGLVFSNGHKWSTHRRIATPAFNQALSPEVVGKVTIDLINMLDKLSDQSIDVYEVMQRTTIQVLGKVAFSYDFKCLENLETQHDLLETYEKLLELIRNPISYIVPLYNDLPTKSNVEFEKSLEKFDKKMLEIIQNKKDEIRKSKVSNNINDENPTSKNDLLYGMLKAAEKEGYDISSNHLRDEMVTFFLAGHDTTSLALSVIFYHLAKYPKIQNKAREEAINVLGVKGKIPSSEDLKNLKYVNAIIKESLRLYPSLAVTVPRITNKELNYGGMTIPKDTKTSVNIWAIHHDPKNWPDPYNFDPERFLSNKSDNNLHAWMPFSSGPRNCIGQNFSLMEQRVIVSMLLLSYEISLPLKSPHKNKLLLSPGTLLAPRNLGLTFSKRK